ncbi:LamG domain-containing protein [Streptomyces antibioticus]|uniref:LamG domain-containing protein n=1 Tax=Streptomyces antibioticus TaxID=1890 RepID=UPI0036FA2842
MAYADVVLADSPSIYFKLDEASGNLANTGSLGGSASYGGAITRGQAGIPGGSDSALAFGNTALAYARYSVAPSLFNGTYSIETWFKTSKTDGTICIYTRSPYFYLSTNGSGKLYFVANDGQSPGINLTSSATVTDGNWHHAVVVIRDSGTNRLYLDGVQVASNTVSPSTSGTTGNLELSYASGSYALNGTLDEFAVYASALSSTRVLAHYNTGATAPGVEKVLEAGSPGLAAFRGTLGASLSFAAPVVPPVTLEAGKPGLATFSGSMGATIELVDGPTYTELAMTLARKRAVLTLGSNEIPLELPRKILRMEIEGK